MKYDDNVSDHNTQHEPVDPSRTVPGAAPQTLPKKEALTSLAHGRYLLVDRLDEGGMATVERAADTVGSTEIAVKLLHPGISERVSYRSRFLAEARTMARINHPNVLRVYEVGDEGGRYWFTMEIVDGGALI